MVKLNTVFTAADAQTPEFAAKLAKHAERFSAELSIECGGKCLQLDSLIGILAMELYRGVPVTILAEGADEVEAAEEIRRVLQGEA